MTKVTVTIDTQSNARLFLELIKELSFVKDIKAEGIYNDNLTQEEINLLEERWSDYVKNPEAVKPWEDVKAELIKKHGTR